MKQTVTVAVVRGAFASGAVGLEWRRRFSRALTHCQALFILMHMSIRLQVILNDEEMHELKERAEQDQLTVSAWVRRAIQHEMRERPGKRASEKLATIRKSASYEFPTGDYEEIASQIEAGYHSSLPK